MGIIFHPVDLCATLIATCAPPLWDVFTKKRRGSSWRDNAGVAKNTTMLDAETAAHDHHYGDDDADDEGDDADDAEARMTMMTIMLMMVQMIMMMLMLMLPPMLPFCLVRVTLALMFS